MIYIILVLAAFLRLYRLDTLPISLFGDEIDVGYHAWSLITTGRDYMGNLLPTYIRSLAEWRAPLLMYLTAPFVGLLGPSAWSVRLPVALLGILSVYLIYLLADRILQNKKTALLSAFLLAITPWHIHYSRAAFEVVPLIFLVMLGVYLFLKGKYYQSFIPFVLTFYTYSTAMVFVPLLILGLLLIEKPKLNLKKNWIGLILPSLLFLPVAYNTFFGPAGNRFGLISIFGDFRITEQVILARTDPWVPKSPVETIFHNKYLGYLTAFTDNYLTSFSPQFLFISGDPSFRHSISKVGELLLITFPLFLCGLYCVFKNLSEKSNKLLLIWLLLAPVPSALTIDGGTHATRLFLMLPPLVLISAMGGVRILELAGSKWRKLIISLFILFSFVNLAGYWHRYSAHYRYESAEVWGYGFKEIFGSLKKYDPDYDRVYINNSYQPTLLPFLFYTAYPPSEFHKNFVTDNSTIYNSPNFKGFIFDNKYYFGETNVGIEDLKVLLDDKTLYLGVHGKGLEGQGNWDLSKETPNEFKTLYSVRRFTDTPLFYLFTGTKKARPENVQTP